MRRWLRNDERIRRITCFAIIVGFFSIFRAWAGPNGGGTLIVHDTGQAFSRWDQIVWPAAPASCEQVDNQTFSGLGPNFGAPSWQVYAAFPAGSSPRLKALAFGERLTLGVGILGASVPDPAHDFEIPQAGWPTTDGGGVAISFLTPKTDLICEVYRFWGYAYYATGDSWATAPHPTTASVFADDSFPPQEDPIAGFSSLGFGAPGVTVCPGTVGACCLDDSSCQVLNAAGCAAIGGTFHGVGTSCEPNPCEPTPVEKTTWGRIKASYR